MKGNWFKVISLLVATLFVLGVLAGCGPAPATEAPKEGGTGGEPTLKVVNVVNGVLGDKSFFDSCQRGVDRAKNELGIEYKTIEAGVDPANWQPALKDAAENEEYDVLIVGTWQMTLYLQEVAPQHPDKKFIIYDADVDREACPCENVYAVLYKQNEGSYLAGVLAAAMTTQDGEGWNPDPIIGAVGGQDIPVINDFVVGYKQGALSVNPDTQVIVQYAGGWNDPAKGKELALAMYSQGADIVFQIAGGTGEGVFEAAAEQGHWAIGVDSDQATIMEQSDPEQAKVIITSMMKNVDNSLFRALDLHLKGELKYGAPESIGIAEGGVGLAKNKYYDELVPDDVKKLIEQAEKDILDGKITVDTAF